MRAEFHRGLASLCALLAPIVLCPLSALSRQKPAAVGSAQRPVQFRNAEAGVAYVGSKACAECHFDIYESYRKTDMGRAMSLPGDWKDFDGLAATVKVDNPKTHRSYEVYRRGADLFQSEYELDAEGKEVFRDDQRISYIVGSDVNGLSCIVRRGDFLFEAPLSYYSQAKAWGLSPGYEQRDYGFNRPIRARCIVCHSGRPQFVEASEVRFKDPPLLELSIGCESCHGPGALHFEERKKAAPLDGESDRSIVNPAGLPPWLANNVCMYCHEGGDVRTLMPGKGYVDFRPGTPLADTVGIFAVPFDRQAPPQDLMLRHFVLMSLSQCYLKSGGKLACITCHDPHRQPSPEEAAPFFRSKCLTCHTERSCTLPLEMRAAKTPPDDCAGCHMPKQPLRRISHSSLTDHRILARAGEPLPESAFHLATTQLPDLVQVDSVPGPLGTPVPPLTLFRAYGELMATHPYYPGRFESVLDSLAAAKTEDAAVLAALARRKMRDASAESQAAAANYLQQALRAGSTDANDFEQLATIQAEGGKTRDAIATVKRGMEVNPYSPRLFGLLATLYISLGSYDDALKTMQKDLELFPGDDYIRSLMQTTERAQAQESGQ
ncbi:MAG TPA: tetratricopeptide repeat protein [Terriglobia bacterium]|nr:tetratricopeptide repeat protein [Terriglobia bacterium]